MTINRKISLINFYDSNRSKDQIKYIILHYVGAVSTAKNNKESNISSDSNNSNKSSEYTTGRYEVTCDVLTVRKGPGTNYDWLRYSQLTSNAQKQIYEKSGNKPNGLVKGVQCDVSQVSGNWGKIPSRLDLK